MDVRTAAQRIKEAPHTPGVYFWRDASGTPVYIGKANDLRSRLSSYPRTEVMKTQVMVQEAVSVDWRETDTEIEALILEAQLIKQYRPKFNVAWRDDKQYLVVAITDEAFPQIIITHQYGESRIKRPVRELLGPFTEAAPLRATLHALRRLFPYCTCKTRHHVKCLNAHIGRCPGYCCLKAEPTKAQIREYARNIRNIRDILSGKRDTVIRRMAGTDPDTAMKLLRVFRHAQISARTQRLTGHADAPHRVEGYDVANILGKHAVGAMVVFTDGAPDKSGYRLFNIKTAGGDTDMLRELLERRMKHDEWPAPDLVVVDGGKAQMNVARSVLGASARIVALTKDDRHHGTKVLTKDHGIFQEKFLSDMPRTERDLVVHVDAEAHRFSIGHYRRRHTRSLLGR